MARDYKRARSKSKGRGSDASPVKLLVAGFSLGVIAAAIVYYVLTPAPPKRLDTPVPMSARSLPGETQTEPAGDVPATRQEQPAAPAPTRKPASGDKSGEKEPSATSEFWEYLVDYEVILPEDDEELQKTPPPSSIEKPGTYLLQVGSFRRYEDADRLKARLALLGIECDIKRVTVDDRVVHRVRVGPESDLGRVNQLRQKLSDENISILLIRIPG